MLNLRVPHQLIQGNDEDALIAIADAIEPGFLVRSAEGEFVMRVPGDLKSGDLEEAEQAARDRFSALLGVLRAKKYGRGELAQEVARSPIYDDEGNVVVRLRTLKADVVFPGVLERFASNAAVGMAQSADFQDALTLLGQPNRDATAYNNIHELARKTFGGPDGIAVSLGISKDRQREFRKSANNLAPTKGGRHAQRADPGRATMTMEELSALATEFVASWINTYAPRSQGQPPVVQYP